MNRPEITCSRCGGQGEHRGRGLCPRCYQKLHRLDRLERHPLTRPDQTSMYCLCDTPALVRIPLFQATYCGTCHRSIHQPDGTTEP